MKRPGRFLRALRQRINRVRKEGGADTSLIQRDLDVARITGDQRLLNRAWNTTRFTPIVPVEPLRAPEDVLVVPAEERSGDG